MTNIKVGIVGIGNMGSVYAKSIYEKEIKGAVLSAVCSRSVKALEITNAIYLSAWEDCWVDLPINEEHYYEKLQEKIAKAKAEK
ncbi:MAG TPA: hypothetical protein VJ824_13120 [Bacillota bacterium]|nr:hypothetical protein [Bacillota bacterium]